MDINKVNFLYKFLFAVAAAVMSGVCLSEEIKRAKVGNYEYSYYVETNGTAVIGRYRDLKEDSNPPKVPAITSSPSGKLILPSSIDGHTVSSVGALAFVYCTNLVEIVIPEGVKCIGEGAFGCCSNLVNITLPVSLESIEGEAFYDCVALKKLVLPRKLREIGGFAWEGCDALSFIRIPASLKWSGRAPKMLRSVYFDDGVECVPWGGFSDCKNLEKVRLPKSLKSIQGYAFKGCSSLSRLDLPEGMSTIGPEAFKDCVRLKNITIPSTVTNVFASAFSGTPDLSDEGPVGAIVKDGWTLGWRGLKEMDVVLDGKQNRVALGAYHLTHTRLNVTIAEDLPPTAKNEVLSVLYGNTNIVTVAIKAPFTDLYPEDGVFINLRQPSYNIKTDGVFGGCAAVEEIELPDTITNLPVRCFSNCVNLKRLRMPKDYVVDDNGLMGFVLPVSENTQLIKSLAYDDNRSFSATQLYFDHGFYSLDLYAPRFYRFKQVLSRIKQYVKDHPYFYTNEMKRREYAFETMMMYVCDAMHRAMKGEFHILDSYENGKRKETWTTISSDIAIQSYAQLARDNLVQFCAIFEKAYDMPKACEYILRYWIDKDDLFKRVDYYKRMARHEARWQQVFEKGTDEYASAHESMLEYLQEISDLGYDQQAQMLQIELEREIAQGSTGKAQQKSGTGTGWFVNKKCVATCWHVVDGAKTIRVQFPDGRCSSANVVAKDSATDLVVLEVNNPLAGQSSLPIRTRGAKLSDKVFTVGYPLSSLLGQAQKYTEGSISAMSGIAGDNRCFQISTPIQPGNSGGPLIDEGGHVIGLTSASLNAVKTAQIAGTLPQNVNYAIKARYLVAILDDAGIPYDTHEKGVSVDKDAAVRNAMKATCMVIVE